MELTGRERWALVIMALKVGQFGSDLDPHAHQMGEELGEALAQFRHMETGSTKEDGPDIQLVVTALRASGFGPEKSTDWVEEEVLTALSKFVTWAVEQGFYDPKPKRVVYKGGDESPQIPLPIRNHATKGGLC